jgi:hypothetical protein
MTTRMDRINKLTADLRDLLDAENTAGLEGKLARTNDPDLAIAEHYGIDFHDLDKFDFRLGCSVREHAEMQIEKWGTL